MAYIKTVWTDEVLDGAERFEILDNAGAAVDAFADLANCQIALATGVTSAGTVVDAANMNNIEDGIEDLATGAAMSVKGVAGGAAGDVDDIEAGTDGYVLRRSGSTIGFGQLKPAGASFFDTMGADAEIFVGRVNSDGSAGRLPSGWSSSKISVGSYTVTHNLATTDYMVVSSVNTGSNPIIVGPSRSSVSFTISIKNAETNISEDQSFSFILIRY